MNQVNKVLQKIQQNSGKLAPDPLTEVTRLRKSGKLKEAYNLILPYVKTHQQDENAINSFGWVMYSLLKETENNIDSYCQNLELFNKHAVIMFTTSNEQINTLKTAYLWSIRKVAMVNELNANRVFEQFIKLCGIEGTIFELRQRIDNSVDPARLLVKDFFRKLNMTNYLEFIRFIGFEWFANFDYETSTFENLQGESIEMRPLAEWVLNFHAKKLINYEYVDATDIDHYISFIEQEISKNSKFKWLPYYKIKLLIKNKRNKEALNELSVFAREKSKEFWIWDLLSEVVPDDDKFAYQCKGLLCKSKPEMLVNLQERIIPSLLAMELYSNAKFELDSSTESRTNKGWPISSKLNSWKNEEWYSKAESINNREGLREYAKKAEKILYIGLPETNVFINYINEGKGIINFYFINSTKGIEEGYFYIDYIEESIDWKTDQPYRFKMVEDSKRKNLYRVYEVAAGDEKFVSNFIQSGSGYIEKKTKNLFAFVNDVFIPPKLVEQYNLSNEDQIKYEKKIRFNKKINSWRWTVEIVNSVSKDD